MKYLRISGLGTAATLFVVTTIYFIGAIDLGAPVSGGQPTASFFPLLLSVMMYMSIAYIVVAEIHKGSEREDSSVFAKPLIASIATGIYILLFGWIGYEVSTILFVWVLLAIFGYGEMFTPRGILIKLIAAIAITVMFYLFFTVGFDVRLPSFGDFLNG
jgi:putative tricarboxylic transport membrane protein